jgi:hypothetical protein
MDDLQISPIEGLPAELACEITGCLLENQAFGSVAALAQCSRLLSCRVLPELYTNVGRVNPLAGEDALIWAAENDELETLKALLDCGVNPNAYFSSGLPDSVRQDTFSAQHLRRRLSPRVDGHLVANLLRERIVWRRGDRVVQTPQPPPYGECTGPFDCNIEPCG